MGQKEEKPDKGSWYWFFKGIAECSIGMSDDMPFIIRPFMRFLLVPILLIFTVLATPLIMFRHFFPKSKADSAYGKAKMELETTWYEESPGVALEKLRDLRNQLKESEVEVYSKGKRILPYGRFKGFEYYQILDLLYHWETRLNNYQAASDLCDEMLEPYFKEEGKERKISEEWFVRKARTIKALEGPLAAQEFLMPYVDHDKEDSHLRYYFLELRDGTG